MLSSDGKAYLAAKSIEEQQEIGCCSWLPAQTHSDARIAARTLFQLSQHGYFQRGNMNCKGSAFYSLLIGSSAGMYLHNKSPSPMHISNVMSPVTPTPNPSNLFPL